MCSKFCVHALKNSERQLDFFKFHILWSRTNSIAGHSSLIDVEEAVHLLHAPSLKVVAKHFRLDFSKGKSEICRSLMHFATQKNVFGITMEKRVLHK